MTEIGIYVKVFEREQRKDLLLWVIQGIMCEAICGFQRRGRAVDYYNPHTVKLDRSLIAEVDKDRVKQGDVKYLIEQLNDKPKWNCGIKRCVAVPFFGLTSEGLLFFQEKRSLVYHTDQYFSQGLWWRLQWRPP